MLQLNCLLSLLHPPEDVQSQLSRHLLRTVCTDMVNLVFNLLAADHMIAVADEATLTTEVCGYIDLSE